MTELSGFIFQNSKAVNEVGENLELPAERGAATAGLGRRILKCAVFMAGDERIVEMVEQSAAGNDKVPAFHPVNGVARAAKAGFVVADDFVQMVVRRHGVGRHRVVKIENRNERVRIVDLR